MSSNTAMPAGGFEVSGPSSISHTVDGRKNRPNLRKKKKRRPKPSNDVNEDADQDDVEPTGSNGDDGQEGPTVDYLA